MSETPILRLEMPGVLPEIWVNDTRYTPTLEDTATDVSEPEPQGLGINLRAFFDQVRAPLFHGSLRQGQVEGCELILATCQLAELDPFIEQTAYVLATVYQETASTMQPIAEFGGKNKRYAPWYGRGHVQLTWEENYAKQQAKLGPMGVARYQVHDDPELALNPQTSAMICVHGMKDGDFTGKKLVDSIKPGKVDYRAARRIVNGTDRAERIASYATIFEAAVRAATV